MKTNEKPMKGLLGSAKNLTPGRLLPVLVLMLLIIIASLSSPVIPYQSQF